METTPLLNLPYLQSSQAQKHVTLNESLRRLDAVVQIAALDRDLATPPGAPTEGDRYIIAAGATGDWSGADGQLAAFQDGAWALIPPQTGWRVYLIDEDRTLVWTGAAWSADAAVDQIGVNATADATNRLAVAAEASLLTHAGAGHQVKINKAAPADTASLLFQTAFSGRAEIGLAGDDQLRVKVSADGTTWYDALLVDPATGAVSFPNTPGL